MTTKLIKIGNSRGIVIPSSILKEMELKEKDNLLIHTEEHKIILSVIADDFTGPFTGPFAQLATSAPVWGGEGKDAMEVAREFHDARVNTREIPEW